MDMDIRAETRKRREEGWEDEGMDYKRCMEGEAIVDTKQAFILFPRAGPDACVYVVWCGMDETGSCRGIKVVVLHSRSRLI